MAAGCWRQKPYKTSDTAFCLSCPSMSKPFGGISGNCPLSNKKVYARNGPIAIFQNQGMDYLFAKLKASKDIYHEFVSGKIDSDDKFRSSSPKWPKQYGRIKTADSAACRSCHSFDTMDISSRSESAQKMHNKAQKDGETCIDCHKALPISRQK